MATCEFKGFKLSAKYTGSKKADWGNGHENWNHHKITVKNTETGKQTSFDFWASIANPEVRSREDLIGAFECFVGDAVAGMNDFNDFCSEFGYDEDSRRAEKIYKACQKATEKLQRIYNGDVYSLYSRF